MLAGFGKAEGTFSVSTDAGVTRSSDALVVNVISTNPAIFFDVAALVAGILMVVTGMTQKRLNWRSAECPTCHHPEELVFLPLALEAARLDP